MMAAMVEMLNLVNRMSPYLLLGFLLAGIMHAFVPTDCYTRFLSRNTMGSVVCAALLGIPLPLCSCGVIPTAMSLRREGASQGATTAFLIATPQTGIDSIMATYALMGLPFAIVRPLAALATSLLGGALANATDSGGGCAPMANPSREEVPGTGLVARLLLALRYACVEMTQDVGKWLAIGLLVAGLITVLLPEGAFTLFQHNTLMSMLLVLAISMPMYLCATGSIPIAVALMMRGLTPGAALVLLMAGPACNFASMLVVRKVMGARPCLTYLVSITAGAVVAGCVVDWLQFHGTVDFLASLTQAHNCHTQPTSPLAWGCTMLLALLLLNALVLTKLKKNDNQTSITAMNTTTYIIEGMNCNHCRTAAEKALLSTPRVESATVDLATGRATVSGTATPESIAKAVSSVGFTLREE